MPRPNLRVRDAIYLAADSLFCHKLRSGLTILGITIAVSSLIFVVAVIEGMNRYIQDRVGNFGAGVFVLSREGIVTSLKEWVLVQKRRRIFHEDMLKLRECLKLARSVAGSAVDRAKMKAGNNSMDDVQLKGATSNLIEMDVIRVKRGRYISELDDQRRAPVCFIGADVADNLFPARTPVGHTLYINGKPFSVIGVADRQGSTFGQSEDSFVHIPLCSYIKMYGSANVTVAIHVQALEPERMQSALDEAELVLRGRRHLKMDQTNDFGIVDPTAIMGLWQRMTGTIAGLALALGAIFLFVGGVVVMNIMLAAVSERTREIGIRKSIGACRRDILLQFLVESVTLTTTGGVIGVGLAYALTELLTWLTPVPSALPFPAVLLSLLVSASVGLFFGLYPANRAARLDPIVAVRVE